MTSTPHVVDYSQHSEIITDSNYWISEIIVSSDLKKRGNKKDFTVVVVDSHREDESNDGWTVIRKKSHGSNSKILKKIKKKRKLKEMKETKDSNETKENKETNE